MEATIEQRTSTPISHQWWFEWMLLVFCMAAGWLLWHGVDYRAAFLNSPEGAHWLELARQISRQESLAPVLDTSGTLPYFKEWPVYPVLLAGGMKLFGPAHVSDAVRLFQTIQLGFYLVSIALVYGFVQRRMPKPYSYFTAILYAVSPVVFVSMSRLTPDGLYIVLSLIALLGIDRYLRPSSSQGFWLSALLLIAVTAYTHVLGLALVLGCSVLSIPRMGFKRGALTCGVFALLMTPWIFHFIEKPENALHPVLSVRSSSVQVNKTHKTSQALALDMNQIWKSVTHYATEPQGLLQQADKVSKNITAVTLGVLHLGEIPGAKRIAASASGKKLKSSNLVFHNYAWVRWITGSLVLLGFFMSLFRYRGLGSLYFLTVLGAFFWFSSQGLQANGSLYGWNMLLYLPLLYILMGVMGIGKAFRKFNLPLTPVLLSVVMVIILSSSLSYYMASGLLR